MPKLPRYLATTPPPREAGGAYANDIGALTRSSGQAEAQAWQNVGSGIGDVGNVLFQIDQEKRELDRQLKYSQATQEAKIFVDEQDEAIDSMQIQDLDQQEKVLKQTTFDFEQFLNKRIAQTTDPKLKNSLEIYRNEATAEYAKYMRSKTSKKWADYHVSEQDKMADAFIKEGDLDRANKIYDLMDSKGLVTHEWALNKKEQAVGLLRQVNVETVRANYQAVIDNGGTKEQAYQVIDEGVQLFGLSAKEKETLGNNLDNYVEGRIKKAADSKHEKTMSAYKDFATKLVTTDVSMNDIESAGFDKDAKEGWQAIIKGSTEPAPLVTTGVGYSAALDSVISSQVIGKKQAYDEILTARFVDKTINDDTYLWAISRIENPYPKHIAETVKGITSSAENYYRHKGVGIFGRDWVDKKENQLLGERNAAFIDWLENEGKDGKYPDGKTMYSKMREFGVTIETPETLPIEPIVAPKKADPLYITNDEDYDKLASGTRFYDAVMNVWRMKP